MDQSIVFQDRYVPFNIEEGAVLGNGAEYSSAEYAINRGIVSSESQFPAVVITAPRAPWAADNQHFVVSQLAVPKNNDWAGPFAAPIVPLSVSPWSEVLVQIQRNGSFVYEGFFELSAPSVPTSGARVGC
jgi:hypothetical protein